MLVDGISRRELQKLAMQALLDAGTLARDRVFEPRDWPTRPDMLPALLVQAPRDRKLPLYPGMLAFTTTVSLVVVGRAAGTDPDAVNDLLDELAGQIEHALMLTPVFSECIQRWASIESQSAVSAEGKQHFGDLGMTFELEIYQAFGPATGDSLTSITGTVEPNGLPGVQPITFQTKAG
jgi:hypothetical protein